MADSMIPYRKRILIVDDSPTSLVWQLVLLQEEHYDTITATTASEGVRIARLERPDLVVLDATIRRSEVMAAANDLRADPETRHIPILVIGRLGSRSRLARQVDPAWDDHVVKPLQGLEYIGKIRDLLQGRRGGGER